MFRSILFLALLYLNFASVDAARSRLMDNLVNKYTENTKERLPNTGACTANKLAVRKEWGSLDKTTRLDYIRAVKCLHTKPSKIGAAKAPGARSRYDDFTAAHMIQTTVTHGTGNFFAWHRRFLILFEKALREECGYSGYQPYWDWSKYADLPIKANPLYDGSYTSMSGNGRYIPNRNGTEQPVPVPLENPPVLSCPPGTGGGYIFEGPFVDWKLHLGPVVKPNVLNGQPVNLNPREDGLGYNPRRMIRDFNNALLLQSNTYDITTNMLVNMTTIQEFQTYLFINPHTNGHLFISGYDNDLFTSPGDPLFWFHHGQIDRLYSIWQSLDFNTRESDLDGTITILNIPPSRDATLEDLMEFEFSPAVTIGSSMSPTKNGNCYIYQ